MSTVIGLSLLMAHQFNLTTRKPVFLQAHGIEAMPSVNMQAITAESRRVEISQATAESVRSMPQALLTQEAAWRFKFRATVPVRYSLVA